MCGSGKYSCDMSQSDFIQLIEQTLSEGPEQFNYRIKDEDIFYVFLPILTYIHNSVAKATELDASELKLTCKNTAENRIVTIGEIINLHSDTLKDMYVKYGWHKSHPLVLYGMPSAGAIEYVNKEFMTFEKFLEDYPSPNDGVGNFEKHIDYLGQQYERMKTRYEENASRIKRKQQECSRVQKLIDQHWQTHNNCDYDFITGDFKFALIAML